MNKHDYQTSHSALREVLKRFLVGEVESSRGVGGCGPVVCGAVATLDSLLAAHPVDRRGRCRSCQRLGWPGRRPRVCLVFQKAHYWLRQSTDRVQAHLAAELGVAVAAPPGAGDPEPTEMLPKVTDDPSTDFLRPDRDHGGVGGAPESPRPRQGVAGPGRATAPALVSPPPVHHYPRVAR